MKTLFIAALNVAAFATLVCANLPSAERAVGRVALSTGNYEVAVHLYIDALQRDFAGCMFA